jgi:hypothetical protein
VSRKLEDTVNDLTHEPDDAAPVVETYIAATSRINSRDPGGQSLIDQ